MKGLKRDLQSLLKRLRSLTQKTERIAKDLEKVEKARTAKRPKAKARVKPGKHKIAGKVVVRKPANVTAIDTVMGIIKKSKKGVDTTRLKEKTGFDDKKIWNAVNRLKTMKKVKSKGRGLYVTA